MTIKDIDFCDFVMSGYCESLCNAFIECKVGIVFELFDIVILLAFNIYISVIVWQDVTTHTYDGSDVITLPVKRQFERVELSAQVF